MMLEKGKVSLHQAYPTFDNLLFNKIAREIIIDNISVEDFVKNFKDEAQKAIDSDMKDNPVWNRLRTALPVYEEGMAF